MNSYNASKLELYILYLTFKAPISKITIGFIKNIHLIILCIFVYNELQQTPLESMAGLSLWKAAHELAFRSPSDF